MIRTPEHNAKIAESMRKFWANNPNRRHRKPKWKKVEELVSTLIDYYDLDERAIAVLQTKVGL